MTRLALVTAAALIAAANPTAATEPDYLRQATVAIVAHRLCGPLFNQVNTMVYSLEAQLPTTQMRTAFCREGFKVRGMPL